jgi:hypothetical protein
MDCPAVKQLALEAVGRTIDHAIAWSNIYFEGESIPWHRDSCGDIQLLLVIREPDRDNGGIWLESKSGPHFIRLRSGDALLFTANRIPHATKPTQSHDSPRITAAMRFFAPAQNV